MANALPMVVIQGECNALCIQKMWPVLIGNSKYVTGPTLFKLETLKLRDSKKYKTCMINSDNSVYMSPFFCC